MCGIFGWFRPGRRLPRNVAVNSVRLMRHRGPDDEGYLFCQLGTGRYSEAGGEDTPGALELPDWRDDRGIPDADAVLGFRRLSIQDLSPAGHQPMATAGGRLWITFNGEVYNFPELRRELEDEGAEFRSGSDTEVVLKAFELWGKDCLKRFNGMWGLAILDLRNAGRPSLLIARDRCGVKPVFFLEGAGGELAFASELKSLVALMPEPRAEEVAFANYIAWGRLPSQRHGDTFVQGVRSLPPGCLIEWAGGKASVERWWDLPASPEKNQAGAEEAVEHLRWLLEDAVKIRLRADVPVGSCLSGGVDSSIIVGLAARHLPGGEMDSRQHTFSAVYKETGPFNEREHIEKVVSALNVKSNLILPDAEGLLEDFDKLVWHQEEPFPTTSMYAQWCVMRRVREAGVTVLLDGQAADELFAGYRPYRTFFHDLVRQRRLVQAWREAKAVKRETGSSCYKQFATGSFMALVSDDLIRTGAKFGYLRALESAANALRSPVRGRLLSAVADEGRPESYPWRRTAESLEEHLRGLVSDFVLPNLLRYEDRNSMAWSVEARVPFTDFRLVEFAFSGACDELRIRNGWSKWGLRKAGAGVVPDSILWRRDKMGFGTPETDWLKVLLRKRGSTVTEPGAALHEFVDPESAKECVQAACGDSRKGPAALRLIVGEQWLRQLRSGGRSS